MELKNSHITYVYLILDVKTGVLFTMANDNGEYDYSEEGFQVVGVRIINWGKA